MKRLFRNIALIASMATMVGCAADQGDIIEGFELGRCLAPTNLEAEIVAELGNAATLTWDAMEGTEKHTVEVYEATEYATDEKSGKDVAVLPDMDAEGVEPVRVVEDVVGGTCTVKDFPVDKDYFVRVKGHAAGLEDSKWAVLEKSFTTAAVRTKFKVEIVTRTENSLTVSWSEGLDPNDLTSLRAEPVSKKGAKSVTVALTPEMIAARSVTAEGLDASVHYNLSLYYGKGCNRGNVTAWTRPVLTGANRLDTVEAIEAAIASATGDITIEVPYNDGVPYTFTTDQKPAVGLTIIGIPDEKGNKPVFVKFNAQLQATCTLFHLEDLFLDGTGLGGNNLADNKGAALTAAKILNCEIANYPKCLYYDTTGNTAVADILFEGNYIHDCNADGAGGGDLIDIRKSGYNDITIQNNTIHTAARSFFRMDGACANIVVKNNTFNAVAVNAAGNNNGLFYVTKELPTSSFEFTKNVVLNENSEDAAAAAKTKFVNKGTAPVSSGNYFFNLSEKFFDTGANAVTIFGGDAFTEEAAMKNNVLLEVDPCQSSGAGKFYLNNTSDIADKQAGDPRWWHLAIPEPPVRATELVAVTEDYTWDFTNKSIFDGETLTAPTIIDNTRIYASAEAPTEVMLGLGLYFEKAGVLGGDGAPSHGAVGILVDGVGGVEVVAEGANGVETISVISGEDRYSVLADGETHKVLFGDFVGENEVWVVVSDGVTLKSVAWTKDLTPEATMEVLATPGVSFDNRNVDEGSEMAVTASWDAVENADHYEVTWRGATIEQTECTFTIDAATVAAMGVGEYDLMVVAVPVATSSKYLRSEAGSATLKINKVVVGGEKTLLWNFSDTIWETEVFDWLAPLGSDGSKDMDVTVDGLRVVAGGSNIRGYLNEEVGNYLQPNGGGSTTKRCFSFTAPANGTLRVKVGCTGSEDLTRFVKVQVGEDGAVQEQPGGHLEPTWVEFDIEASNQTVYIYPSGGLRFYAIEYTYIEAAPKAEYIWNFSDTIWETEVFDWLAPLGSDGSKDMDVTVDGLRVVAGGSNIRGYLNEEVGNYLQPNGGGSTTKRCFSFTAPANGTLRVKVGCTGSEDLTRFVKVQVGEDGAVQEQPGGHLEPTWVEFDIEASNQTVYIYPSGGLRFYAIEYKEI